jgi:hypothetical protein
VPGPNHPVDSQILGNVGADISVGGRVEGKHITPHFLWMERLQNAIRVFRPLAVTAARPPKRCLHDSSSIQFSDHLLANALK